VTNQHECRRAVTDYRTHIAVWNTTTQSPAPVCVGAVVDAMDPDCLGLVVNPMEHPVGATACAVLACELAA
jgi:hypothetical protein